jgi:hypothetical protein
MIDKEQVARPAISNDPWLSRLAYFFIAGACCVALIAFVRHFSNAIAMLDLPTIIGRHGPAVLGIPGAAMAAFAIIGITRALDGPMALDFVGIKAEGAAATAIIWIAVFLSISLALRTLW